MRKCPLGGNEVPPPTPIDLAPFGCTGVFNCRGRVASSRLDGRRLLFLFGERHSIKPYIREHLLNVVDLCKLGAISCVGVEGRPGDESARFPGHEATAAFEEQKANCGGDVQTIIESMLSGFRQRDFYFWKTLVLLRPLLACPSLAVESVEDAVLNREAARLYSWHSEIRRGVIGEFLQRDSLFEPGGEDKGSAAYAKADKQWDEELAEEGVNLRRDQKFIENMLALWDRSGPDKAAVLYAGTSHQYRIARQLPPGISHYHIEQP
jgi:hypothetical protein